MSVLVAALVSLLGTGCAGDDEGGDSGADPMSDGASTGAVMTDDSGTETSATGDSGSDSGSDSGGSDTSVDACAMCGEDPCEIPDDDCFDEVFCIPPAPDACTMCMTTSCLDDLGMCGDVSCIDYAATIGGCGDALPYASAYPCMVEMCEEACSPGAGFTACACV